MSKRAPVDPKHFIHWGAVREAFARDREHPARAGRLLWSDEDEGRLLIDLGADAWIEVTVEDPRLRKALRRAVGGGRPPIDRNPPHPCGSVPVGPIRQ